MNAYRALLALVLILGGLAVAGVSRAREAAFLEPNIQSAGGATSSVNEAVTVEPKSDMDLGESTISVARRVTLFFVNQTNLPVSVMGVTISGDANVTSSILNDDCSKEGRIGATSRCSVVIEVTPSSAGTWTAEVLLTHKSAGRIVRAKLSGKAGTLASAERKDTGLALNAKDIKPIDFGTVDVNGDRVVRSAVMINDSVETITLKDINVIAADNGLERLKTGCVVDMELKTGESCPVTLVWGPTYKGQISTDLILRHTGRAGFAVIPLRGMAKDDEGLSAKNTKGSKGYKGDSVPPPSIADEVVKASDGKIAPVSGLASSAPARERRSSRGAASTQDLDSDSGTFRLIGTVGRRVVLLKPDGTTAVVDIGEDIPYGDGLIAKITNVTAESAEIFQNGRKRWLTRKAASELVGRAASVGQRSNNAAQPTPSTPVPPPSGAASR